MLKPSLEQPWSRAKFRAVGGAGMPASRHSSDLLVLTYRVYLLDAAGGVVAVRDFPSDNDETALRDVQITWPKADVWHGKRRVGFVRERAISREPPKEV
jgi:hypothetical protein